MDHEELITTTRTLAGFSTDAEAERAVEAVLETLGERLSEAAAVRLATFLPDPEAGWLLRRRVPGAFGRVELTNRVGRRESIHPGFAIEHALVVCEAMATLLPEEEIAHVRQALPEDIAALFTRWSRVSQQYREPRSDDPHADTKLSSSRGLTQEREERTLATGRPCSSRPLSSSR